MGRILITGVCGFIGFHTAKMLLENGHQIVGIDNMNRSYDVLLKEYRLSKLVNFPNFRYYKKDISIFDDIKPIFLENTITKIIHLAARAGVRKSVEEPQEFITSNILGTINLLELSKDFGIRNFVNASSSSVYSGNKLPFFEKDNIDKIKSPYGVTKRATEMFAYNYHNIYKLNIVNLRFFTVYGSAARPDMSILKFIKFIDTGHPIHIFGDGTQTRSFTFISDIVNGIIKSLDITGYEIINLGNDKRYALSYLINLIEKYLNKKAKMIYENPNNLDAVDTLPDIKKASELLNWRPKIDLDEGILKTVKWHIENKELIDKLVIE